MYIYFFNEKVFVHVKKIFVINKLYVKTKFKSCNIKIAYFSCDIKIGEKSCKINVSYQSKHMRTINHVSKFRFFILTTY